MEFTLTYLLSSISTYNLFLLFAKKNKQKIGRSKKRSKSTNKNKDHYEIEESTLEKQF